jgi:hypothetical protein
MGVAERKFSAFSEYRFSLIFAESRMLTADPRIGVHDD